ncbi:MAG: diguanylate cyclase [Mycobacterium leprae]
MLTWTYLLPAVFGLLAASAAGYAVVAHRRYTRTLAQLQHQTSHEKDLVSFNRLLRQVTEADWQHYPVVLVNEIVKQGYATRAALLAVRDQGQLSLLAATDADGTDWDPRTELAVQTALEQKVRLHLPAAEHLYLPIPEQAEPIGMLVVSGPRWGATDDAESLWLEAMAALVHLALIDQRTLTRQLSLSITDGLTGLINHRHFQQTLSVIIAQSYLEHTSMALAILDIDHFKRLNDTYGHLFGDMVLREVAGVLRRTAPAKSMVARYGGEEFAVILPGHSLEEAARAIETLREAIEQHRVTDPTTGKPVGATVSAGVALYQLGMGKSKLIARADEALYESKQTGRNRVTVVPPEADGRDLTEG